jgi:hypothetical protein
MVGGGEEALGRLRALTERLEDMLAREMFFICGAEKSGTT